MTRAASSNRMAFLATRPINMMTPMKLIRLSVPRVINSANTTPIRLSGSDSITASGAVKLLNCITRIRYISAMPDTSAMPICLNTCCWSRDAPANSSP